MPAHTSIYAYLEKPTMVDYAGHFAAIFFVSGCSFRCGYCHNAKLMARQQAGLSWEKLAEACENFQRQWVNAVVISGGEPTSADDLVELIRFFKGRGFAVKLDTNGSNPERLSECLPQVDYVAMDIKAGLSLYPEMVGFSGTNKIRRSIQLIKEQAKDYEFRTTIIETVHTDEQMLEVRDIVQNAKRYIMQPFIPRDNLPKKEYRSMPRTTAARLKSLEKLMDGCADELLLRGT